MIETFYRDLKRGKYHENIILDKIKSKYSKAYIIDGYCKDYDIYIPELNYGIEVKSDEKSKYTNNIVIEIEFNGKKSALSTTSYAEFVGKGDTKSKKAYLIKKDILYKYKE